MTELEFLKTRLIEAVQASNDTELLDLVYKLLLAECGNNGLDAGVLVSG